MVLIGALIATDRCQAPPQGNSRKISLINSSWLHSHEEDYDNIKVYRPDNFDFPPSKGRTGFQFGENGQGGMGLIAPTDGINWVPMQWNLSTDSVFTLKLLRKGHEVQEVYHYRLESWDTTKLCLSYLEHLQMDKEE